MLTWLTLLSHVQEAVLSGGHALLVQGYHPVIQDLAKGIDIRLNHRCACAYHDEKLYLVFHWWKFKHGND